LDTLLLPTDDPEKLRSAVEQAVRFLGEGLPVGLPTETVYGLAADATRSDAVLKIFEAKERPFFDPLIVHLPDREWLDRLASIPDTDQQLIEKLVERFWPGPLTLVLPRREIVPDLVTSGLSSVAVRMSAHPVFQTVVTSFGKPLAAPSANRFGRISPTAGQHVISELGGRIPLVVDAGSTWHGVESTIVGVSQGRLEVLRSGPITREELSEFASLAPRGAVLRPAAPGQLKSHYAPRTPLFIQEEPLPIPTKRCGLLAWKGAYEGFDKVEVLSPSGDLREAATHLFAAMRRLDEAGLDYIMVEPVPEKGLGVAVMDRLRRAAHDFLHSA
jgi:L-threonylcarbamoyladenylate synthase